MSTAQVSPSVIHWNRGRRPEEQGWTFGDSSISVGDINSARSFVELQNKGVPQAICDAARRAGFSPSELDEYLAEKGH